MRDSGNHDGDVMLEPLGADRYVWPRGCRCGGQRAASVGGCSSKEPSSSCKRTFRGRRS